MEFSTEKINEVVLGVPYLTARRADAHLPRSAWKGIDCDALNRLHEKALVSNPVSKGKSIVLSDEGFAKAKDAAVKLFA